MTEDVAVRPAASADELAAVLAVLRAVGSAAAAGGSRGAGGVEADGYERWRRRRIAALRARP